MNIPKSPVLRIALGWLLFAGLVAIAAKSAAPATLSQAAGSFLAGLILPAMCGAFASGFILIQVLGFVAAMLFAATVLFARFQSSKVGLWAFSAFMFLSLITLWFDPYISAVTNSEYGPVAVEAVVQTVASSAGGMVSKVMGLFVSGFWVFAWFIVVRELGAELEDSRLQREFSAEQTQLLRESLLPAPTNQPVVQPPPLIAIVCDACQASMPSSNRHCTRCGAPLRKPPTPSGGVR